jgi:hypothetical protein
LPTPAVEAHVLTEDRRFEVAHCRARVDAQFLAECRAQPAIRGEGIRLAAAPVEGEHELPVQVLTERVLLGQLLQLREQLGVFTQRKPGLRKRLRRLHPQFLQAHGLLVEPTHAGHIGQCPTTPQLLCRP